MEKVEASALPLNNEENKLILLTHPEMMISTLCINAYSFQYDFIQRSALCIILLSYRFC